MVLKKEVSNQDFLLAVFFDFYLGIFFVIVDVLK
jgi:hypothetical protein